MTFGNAWLIRGRDTSWNDSMFETDESWHSNLDVQINCGGYCLHYYACSGAYGLNLC